MDTNEHEFGDDVRMDILFYIQLTSHRQPANASVELALSAMNNGGESVRSEVVTVQTA